MDDLTPGSGSPPSCDHQQTDGALPFRTPFAFDRKDHEQAVHMGSADLSSQEKVILIENIHTRMSVQPPAKENSPTVRRSPLYFGSWSGINPFRYVRPFFLMRKKQHKTDS